MTPDRAIEHINVINSFSPSVFSSGVGLALDSLTLRRLEKTLNDCVVLTGIPPTDADLKFIPFQGDLLVIASELETLIRVQQNLPLGRPKLEK